MTVASDLLSQIAGWPDVEATLAKVRADGDSFEEFVVDQLEELERLRAALEERERTFHADRRQHEAAQEELKAERQGLEEQRQSLQRDAEQIEEHAQRLEKSQAELEEARREFARMREAGISETGTATTALLSQLETVERDRAELEQQLAASRAQVGRLADVTAELAEVRAELLRQPERVAGEAKAAMAALEQELNSARAQIARLTEATIELAEVRAELAEARVELLRQPEHTAAAADAAAAEMCSQLEQLEQHGASLEQELAEARGQISRLTDADAELAKVRGELEEARVELLRKPDRSSAEADAAAEDMCRRLAELEQQRSTLEQELTVSRKQVNRLVDATADMAEVRGELAAAHAELLQKPGRSADAGDGDNAWRDQVRDLQHERAMLEAELETVRRRVVELAETASSEKQRTTQERNEWSKEFKQLRKLLEVQSLSPVAKAPAAVEAAVGAPAAQPAAAGGDPILESVMAQFDMLQKDIARRRTGGKKTTK